MKSGYNTNEKERHFMSDKILIVDDEAEIADLIEVYLTTKISLF